MKKLLLASIFGVAAAILITTGAYAKNVVAESPNIKIVIDSTKKNVENVPVMVNGRTMLPLREIATHLGVANDDEHIKWESVTKTVYLAKDNTVINLKIDSKTATVNEQEVSMDVAPIVYKNRTYIPVRFVSQSFGKKVVWDDSTKSVLICTEEDYNKVKETLDKSKAAMDAVKRGKMDLSLDMTTNSKDSTSTSSSFAKITMSSEIDTEKKKAIVDMEMNMFSLMNIKSKSYLADNVIYEKNSLTNKWEKQTKSAIEFNDEFQKNNVLNVLDQTDIISAGLKFEESKNPDEIVLAGDVILKDITDKAGSESGQNSDFGAMDNFNMSFIIEKNTYLIKEIVINATGKLDLGNDTSLENLFTANGYNVILNCSFADLNGNIDVVPPADLDITKVDEKSSDTDLNLNGII